MKNIKKNSWILVLPIIGVILMNIAILPMLLSGETSEDVDLPTYEGYDGSPSPMDTSTKLIYAAICFAVVAFAISAIAVFIAHNRKDKRNPETERRGMLIIKLGLIPFYIFGGMLCFVLAILPATIFVSFFLGIIGWFVMIPGSVWAVCYAFSLRKMGGLKNGTTILFIIMQLIMVLDVISAIVIAIVGYRYEKKNKLIETEADIALDVENQHD